MDPYKRLDFGSRRIVTRLELRDGGLTQRDVETAVTTRQLVRVRRDRYALPETNRHILEAVRMGGRLACVSAAEEFGFFGLDSSCTHVHVPRGTSRQRSPHNSHVPLARTGRQGVEAHWWPLLDPADGNEYCVGARDALIQIIRCQSSNLALAALDTALHEEIIRPEELSDIFGQVPARYRKLRPLVDGRVDAGQETVLRRLVLEAGLQCEIQVEIPGVGRVDMVVEGCLVVEADSRSHHKSWEEHIRDRTRDRLLAERGYVSLRLLYQDIMFDPEGVIRAIRELLRTCREGSRRA